MRYVVYKTDGKITHFHEERKSHLEKHPIEDLIYDYNVKNAEKGQTVELVEVEENSFTNYLIQKLEEQETQWHIDIDNMVDSLEDVINFLESLK